MKDIDAGYGVSIKKYREEGSGKPPLFFPRPWLARQNTKRPMGRKRLGMLNEFLKEAHVCRSKEKGGKQGRMKNMEAKNLPNGRTLTTKGRVDLTI